MADGNFRDLIRTALGMPLYATDAEVLGRAAALHRHVRDGAELTIRTPAAEFVFEHTAHRCALPRPDTMPPGVPAHYACPLCQKHYTFDPVAQTWAVELPRYRYHVVRGDES